MKISKEIISEYKLFFCGLLFFIISMIIFFTLAFVGWPCPPEYCIIHDNPFCEELKLGNLILQPFNTFSNLSLVISGLVILIILDRSKDIAEQEFKNPFQYPNLYPILYAFIVISIGVGSMFFHASLTSYGKFLDEYTMVLYMAFLIIYDIIRLIKQTEKIFLLLYIPIIVILAISLIFSPASGVIIFTIMVAVAFFFEVGFQIATRRKESLKNSSRDWRWLVIGFGIYIIGTIVWLLSNTGDPLCSPYSWIQGHSIWHICVGLATFILFIYVQTEGIVPNKDKV